jgi:hypothetical protein
VRLTHGLEKRLVGVFMHTAIVIDDSGSQSSVQDTVQLLSDVKAFADIIVVSRRASPDSFPMGIWIAADSLVDGLSQATALAASKRVLVVSSSLAFSFTDLSKLVAEIENRSVLEHIIVAPMADDSVLDLPEVSPDTIVQAINRYDVWPLMCVSTSRYALSVVDSERCESTAEVILQGLIQSISDGDSVRISSIINPLVHPAAAEVLCALSPAAKARCLQAAVDGMNIEELFPNHNWSKFSQESAAAAYHSLAALFLRFQDPETAMQCLVCSERLEESPRFFALQGLIQYAQGETLGAVANLVSSLQCYEARKKGDGNHYLQFSPSDLDTIKARLAEGLDALNKRDNAKALASFSDAVFRFDPFYTEHGVANAALAKGK